MGRRRKHDKHLPRGMTLESGTYYVRGGVDRKRLSLGQDFSLALKKYADIVGPVRRVRTLHDVIERYRLEVLPLKKSEQTREDEARSLTKLDAVFGDLLPDELTAPQCYKYLDERRDKNGKLAPVAARHEISLLGHVLTKGIRWGAGVANVVRTLERMPKSKRDRYVTDQEFAACRALAPERMALAMDLARNIGQRRGNILRFKRSQIVEYFDKAEQKKKAGIEFPAAKGGKGVLLEITPALQATLDALKALTPDIPRDYVLRQEDGGPYTRAGFSSNWQRLMRKFVAAGGVRFTFHDLRAKAASDKESIEEAQALLGHASSETTKRVYKRNLTKASPVE
jgi:hypothetical protein